MNITIKQLYPGLLDDYLYFFDEVAFVDNREWGGCYCVFYHHGGNVKEWLSRSKSDNRSLAVDLIKNNALRGFLAYDGNRPVAWCNANDRKLFSLGKNISHPHDGSDDSIASVVCFLVSHLYRRSGISTKLLRAVIDHYKKSGKRYIEAYPFKNVSRECEHYHGPLDLYLKNGFSIDREYDEYYIVRYGL